MNELIKRLGLLDIEVVNVRGEDYSLKKREAFDYVSARAVTNLNALIEVAGTMVKEGGYFIALRGSSGQEEIANANNAISQMGFVIEKTYEERLADGSLRIISFMKKIKETPKKYPRKYSIIKQRPL